MVLKRKYSCNLDLSGSDTPLRKEHRNKVLLITYKQRQESGVKLTIVTLDPEGYPEEKIEDTRLLVRLLRDNAINVHLKEHMHEHFAIIDDEIVWYGSMNLLSRAKADDNLMRVKNKEAAIELFEITFG
jgi:phosphatidylserine/phosphatidylglycerophosphate/cardiolipin synthase-like enzyme